jgi:hypothetical protein
MLICTGVRAGGGPYRYSGANSALAVDRNKSATAALAMGFNISEATVVSTASIANTSGIPSGVRHPQAWVMPVKGGGIKSYKRTDIQIDGAAVGRTGTETPCDLDFETEETTLSTAHSPASAGAPSFRGGQESPQESETSP